MTFLSLGSIDVPVNGNKPRPLDLPKTQLLRNLIIDVTVNVTNTGSVSYHEDAIQRLLTFRVYHGSDPILELRGDSIFHFFKHWHGIESDLTQMPGAAGAQVGRWRFIIPSSDNRLVTNPDATISDMALAKNPRIEVTSHGLAAMTAGTAALDSISVQVTAEVALRPKMPRMRVLPIRRWREILITDLVASTTDQNRQLRFGELIRAYMFKVKDQAASPARSNDIVDKLELAPNNFKNGPIDWEELQALNRSRFGIAPETGIAFMDFDPSKRLNARTMLDLRNAQENFLYVATNAAANGIELTIVEEQILPPDAAAVAEMRKFLNG